MAAIHKVAGAMAFCSAMALTSAWAESVDVKGDTAGQTALTERGVKANGSNATAGAATPVDQKGEQKTNKKVASKGGAVIHPKASGKPAANTPLSESAVAPRADVKTAQGPDAQAIKSADSTAHNTVVDPDDQIRSNSTAGNTQPIPGAADAGSAEQQDAGQQPDAAVSGEAAQ